ncbi:MAG: succinate dehydrogenase cytochrome b subunit [Planctomycetes bacterium]|nr:succinate dehydrogenase cytochrome b subunit [Planctomycetota bacterium]MBZ0154563.1 succinate dehydrogenase cytochrome b subunit [Planctomycetota bacterium]MCC7397936.1 succinate dehydrogenase cytochrome b subunit [Planctomycetota bacterium]
MTWLCDFWRSSVGGKLTMAVTGVLLFLFVVGHLLGNLQLFSEPEHLADYAKLLHREPALLWAVRCVLGGALLLHVVTGIRLARQNRAARPVKYQKEEILVASFASRSMLLTGLTTLGFVVYHLLHFTAGVVHGAGAAKAGKFDGFDVHTMVVRSFENPSIALAYVGFMVVLFFHLAHGIQSFVQTLGLNHARYTPVIRRLSVVVAGLLAGGNILLPLSVLSGIVKVAP